MKKASYLLPLIGYSLCIVGFFISFITYLVWIPSLFEINANFFGGALILLVVIEGILTLFSVWGLLGVILVNKKWTPPLIVIVLVIVGALVSPLLHLSLQIGDHSESEMNLTLLAFFPHFLLAFVSVGNIPGAVLLLIPLIKNFNQKPSFHQPKKAVQIDFGSVDETSLEVERIKSLFKEGLLTEEEAQKQIRDLELTILS